jgi:hypothetical protein
MMRAVRQIIVVATMLALLAVSPVPARADSPRGASPPPFSITFTGPEEVVSFSSQLAWVPDGNIAYLKTGSMINLWLQGLIPGQVTGESTYFYQGIDFSFLTPHQLSDGLPLPVLTPSGAGFDRDYAGSAAVVRASNGMDLLMFYHGEDHSCTTTGHDRTKARVGLARSSDNGASWSRSGQIISSPEMPVDCNYEGFRGAGNPSVVLSRDGKYYYLYFTEWVSTRPDSISLARAAVSSDGAPGAWYKYKNGAFTQPGLGGTSDPVLSPLDQSSGYAGLPNVTFNATLDLYIAIFMGHNGFYYASSGDGIHWDTPTLFWAVSALTAWDSLQDGADWYYYPTLISTDQDSDDTTTRRAYLYYAHGIKPQPHYLCRRPLRIEPPANRIYLPLVMVHRTYCSGADWQQPCQAALYTYLAGNVTIDGVAQYQQGGGEDTLAFFEKVSTVYAPWGATYTAGTIDTASARIQDTLAHGCGSSCSKVRFVIVRADGRQDALCYYPDGSMQPLQGSGAESYCP